VTPPTNNTNSVVNEVGNFLGEASVDADKLVPHRLQYFSPCVDSAPQCGQYMTPPTASMSSTLVRLFKPSGSLHKCGSKIISVESERSKLCIAMS